MNTYGFKGFSNENIELLADLILDIYISEASIDENHRKGITTI